MKKIADSGLIIAALDKGDRYHSWARSLMENESPPWLVCEPVIAEIAACVDTPEPVLQMLQMGDLELAFSIDEQIGRVLELTRKYRDQRMDLADACVVRMCELFDDSRVYTVDKTDFLVYRRKTRQPIPCVFPD